MLCGEHDIKASDDIYRYFPCCTPKKPKSVVILPPKDICRY